MNYIKKLQTGDELSQEFLKHFQQYKVLKQKVFYFGSGVEMYFDISSSLKDAFLDQKEEYLNFFEEYFHLQGKPFVIISLGCADSSKEAALIKRLKEKGYHFSFVGVDSSEDMIEASRKTLENLDVEYQLICADFSTEEFTEEMKKIGSDVIRVFTFLGATFGNVEQAYMADILSDLLKKDDKLWLEVGIRKEISDKNDRMIFERYLGWLESPLHRKFLLKPLLEFNIPEENGDLFLQMIVEADLNALIFSFRFKILEKTVLNFPDHTVTLLPGNIIDLLTIRSYDPGGLTNFFEERKFKLLSKRDNGRTGELMFEKL
ncbi:MAG: hypothetical protein COV59_05115 [Candidatus Magasanikbacteria bacterium CG11_big_fil_rev_8_21_14_0_20_39_34]|uniref:Histidine-specific methyltransferase SAM-dependent domain-containing protein n=1 Tax=Candidatus Magasanikbacteria bacterium CG11_big_fil_rev_8_21_14_0_20_39_34 TaxID=1974653 RepID=A0A2H0N3R5_9BACT|nr:MAG: hypothetical protein COV59_05115 [Candidatus Magasanikbacteria bacterium CG11_big_fil_rev_8_21_14_0_20_39_34]